MALEIREETVDEVRVLGLTGRLDTDTSADLELAVQDLIDAGGSHFVIDLSGVGYVSSAGLRVLLMLGKSVDGKGSLRLCGLNPTVRQVFDVAGFTQLFAISANRQAILAAASPKSARASESPAGPKEGKSREGKVEASGKPAKVEAASIEKASKEKASKEGDLTLLVAKLLGVGAYGPGKNEIDARSVSEVARVLGLSATR
jgi:anti-anti-sigma factor